MQPRAASQVDYSLARRAVLRSYHSGQVSRFEICDAHPDRFVAFASVALQFPELAVQQYDGDQEALARELAPSRRSWPARRCYWQAKRAATSPAPRWWLTAARCARRSSQLPVVRCHW